LQLGVIKYRCLPLMLIRCRSRHGAEFLLDFNLTLITFVGACYYNKVTKIDLQKGYFRKARLWIKLERDYVLILPRRIRPRDLALDFSRLAIINHAAAAVVYYCYYYTDAGVIDWIDKSTVQMSRLPRVSLRPATFDTFNVDAFDTLNKTSELWVAKFFSWK
jgi:hypothetical protein